MCEVQLYDLKKTGTIIVSSPRSGSHYLQHVINKQLTENTIPTVILDQLAGKNIFQDIDIADGKYHVCIANDIRSKEYLIKQKNHSNNWHVVRLNRADLTAWAVGCYFMFQKNSFATHVSGADDIKFKHHGTKKIIYKEHLDAKGNFVYPLCQLRQELQNRSLTDEIPCDVCVDYADLKTYFGSICHWQPNGYPEFVLERDFKNGEKLKEILQEYWLQKTGQDLFC
jgi:hypothetical protein